MKKHLLKISLVIILALVIISPFFAFAQNTDDPGAPGQTVTACSSSGLGNVICEFQVLLNTLIPILITLGIVYFIWGVVQFVIGAGEEAKTKGRDRIISGIIGLAVIVGIWGLVNIVTKTFNLNASSVAPGVSNLVIAPVSGGCTAPTGSNSGLSAYINYFTTCIGSSVIPFIFALAIVSFIWGVVKFFIINADEEAKRAQGKQFMLWGIIALAVMLSIWGLVNILGVTFGIQGGNFLPQVHP